MSSSIELSQAGPVAGASGFLPDRIIHLHPTRLCNLACLHCYSESDPQHKAALDPVVLCDALGVLRAEGYALVSVSGGEPLVYPPLRAVVEHAHSLGFRVTMISNGLLVTERTDTLLSLLDGVAISFDGLADTHDAMRGRPGAFERACQGLKHLADMGRPVAAAISLSRDAIPELPDLADHLVALGARALQVRPVARAGRARGLTDDVFFSAADQARLYLVVLALQQEMPEGVRVHCDLAPARGLWQQRNAYAGLLADCAGAPPGERPLADLVNPLVITDDGVLKPIAYDFDQRFDIAPLQALTADSLRRYKEQGLADLRALVGGVLAGLQEQQGLVDWFDDCARSSEARANAAGHRVEFMPRTAGLVRSGI